MGTSGSEGGPGKRAGSNPGTALRPDPYYPAKIWVNGQYAERPAMPHRVGAGLVGEPIAPGFAA